MRETRIGSSRRVSLYINKALSETMQLSIDLILKLKMQTASRRARNEVKAIFVFLFFRVLVFVFFFDDRHAPSQEIFFLCDFSLERLRMSIRNFFFVDCNSILPKSKERVLPAATFRQVSVLCSMRR